MEKYEITKEQILWIADTARFTKKELVDEKTRAKLREWFPSAFEEWEEVPLGVCNIVECFGGPMIYLNGDPIAFLNFDGMSNYKIDDNRLWRRKSAG